MTKDEFHSLFLKVLEESAQAAESKLSTKIPRKFEIQLYGAGYSGVIMDLDSVFNILYLGEQRFYRVIDVAITGWGDTKTRVFVRVSDHQPATFEKTWNTPPGYGPFKKLMASKVDNLR